jgi:hypothetical protein
MITASTMLFRSSSSSVAALLSRRGGRLLVTTTTTTTTRGIVASGGSIGHSYLQSQSSSLEPPQQHPQFQPRRGLAFQKSFVSTIVASIDCAWNYLCVNCYNSEMFP